MTSVDKYRHEIFWLLIAVEAYGGTIGVDTAPPRDSVFSFELPG